MDELEQLKTYLTTHRPTAWNELPDIPLYMDQLVSYMPRQLIHLEQDKTHSSGDDTLTSAMVNNYIKEGLVPRADGKRYSRTHLSYLTAVCALKRVLSVKNVGTLLSAGVQENGEDSEAFYRHFCAALDQALQDTAETLNEPSSEEGDEQTLARLALDFALRSYADQLACVHILDMLSPKAADGSKKQKK